MTLVESEQEHKLSPMMIQWHACKKAAGSAILLFRMGDFYEAFYEDAVLLSKETEVALTKRQDTPMAGIPWHTSDIYLDKLISKGYRVAVAEQMEDPKATKGIVKREVVRIVTPGTLVSSSLLSDKSNNYFACIAFCGDKFGLAYTDVTTAEFRAIEFDHEQELLNEIYRVHPSELLVPSKIAAKRKELITEIEKNCKLLISYEDDWRFEPQLTYDRLTSHFKVHTLDGYGLKGMQAAACAAGAMIAHMQDILNLSIDHIAEIATYSTGNYMAIDRTTQRNLELTEPLSASCGKNTLLTVLDHTLTPMGARLIKQWVKLPLLSVEEIQKRQKAVGTLMENSMESERLSMLLENVKDLERLIMRVSSGCATPRDLVALKNSLEPIPKIKALLQALKGKSLLIDKEEEKLKVLHEVSLMITNAIVDAPPFKINEGGIFKAGYNTMLDELREISQDSKAWIARYQSTLRETSGIKTLKVGYTRMFGYYVEVSKGQTENVPENFQRRQTLVNGERYITPELKEYETKVVTAEEKIIAIETELFTHIRKEVAKYAVDIFNIAQSLAIIDTVQSLASIAKKRGYCCPKINDSKKLQIDSGKHPVIECLNIGETFVANDVILDDEKNRLLLITGPNMAGKSTYIRQVALLVIMAQIGSYIPAASAEIGIVDKVFTRIGASDDLSRGQSTFMVEMTETANILNNTTCRSLVLLDEIGRGTSTYDGISIAWSVAEHLLTTEGKMAKTLFATHYWELTKLEDKIPGAVNYTVAVHESEDKVVFLRKIIKGGTDKSYGIHVGRLAGLPASVVNRAKEILVHLEENSNRKNAFEPPKSKRKAPAKQKIVSNDMQLTFFG